MVLLVDHPLIDFNFLFNPQTTDTKDMIMIKIMYPFTIIMKPQNFNL